MSIADRFHPSVRAWASLLELGFGLTSPFVWAVWELELLRHERLA